MVQDHVQFVIYVIQNSAGDDPIIAQDDTPDSSGLVIDSLRPGTNYTISLFALAGALTSDTAKVNIVTGRFLKIVKF